MLAHLGLAEALCELFSSLDYSRTRVEEVLVAQALQVIEAALAQEPHVLLVGLPDVVDCLSAVLACRDRVSSSYWTVYKFFASQSQHKYKIIIFFFRRSK